MSGPPWTWKTATVPPPLDDSMTGAIPEAIRAYIARWEAGKVKNATIDETPFNTTNRTLTP